MKGSKKFNPISKVAAGALCLSLALTACTKQRPYNSVDKDPSSAQNPKPKNLIDTQAEYLYVPSSLNSTRTTGATFPLYMGESKIVKIKLTETALNVIEQDPESRYRDNVVNDRPIFSIPITHIDYRCAKDADGKCTQQEEQDTEKPWAQRRYLKVDADRLAVQEISVLPVEIANLFRPCHSEVGSGHVSFNLESDALNIEVEKIYKTDLRCAENVSSLSDLTFRVVYHYSLVRLDSLTTTNYKPFSYQSNEDNLFGFFDTDTLKLDPDNSQSLRSHKKFVNRWAPQKALVYHLSENFNKPEYAKIKAATYRAVANINNSLLKANAQLRIDLRDAVQGQNPGDLRFNTIDMVEDPVSFGILGYGPTAANPRTGEILHGRTVMYMGVMKLGIRRAYEDLIIEKLSKIQKAQSETKTELADARTGALRVSAPAAKTMSLSRSVAALPQSLHGSVARAQATTKAPTGMISVDSSRLSKYAQRLSERRLSLRNVLQMSKDASIEEQILSTHCFYTLDNFNMDNAIESEIGAVIAKVGAKPWEELSDEEQSLVIETLLPFVWVPTLTHELGHNLGLRHNFAGSEDKNNFYTEEELKEIGSERAFKYSSVMDYGYNSTNELQLMGKYDVAALRYAYAEQLETSSGEMISLEDHRKDPSKELREFKFCTDEHVAVNPNCNRFDEGTSLSEIALHWVNAYETGYYRRNFRNGRLNFSLLDDEKHIQRSQLIFSSLRSFFERYESIKQTFGLSDNAKEWEEISFLKDLKAATLIAGNFFVRVLQTPDTLCAIASKAQPDQVVAVVPIRAISQFATSCFDSENIQMIPNYTVVGEGGKSFQSRKDPRNANPYMDQIDVRGTWTDKILAAHALVGRLTGVELFDKFTGSFLDMDDMKAPLTAALSQLILDEVTPDVPFFMSSGEVLTAPIRVQFFSSQDIMNGHKIEKPLSPSLQKNLNIPNTGIDFQIYLGQLLKSELTTSSQRNNKDSLLNSMKISRGLRVGNTPSDFLGTNIAHETYYARKGAALANTLLANIELNNLFNAIGETKLKVILEDVKAKKPAPANASPNEKVAYQVGERVIQKFLDGGFQDNVYYENMVQTLAE